MNNQMIPFFRKIRKQFADDNKPLKYMRYAVGEIVLVVIGILIAIQINLGNEARKKSNMELEIMAELKKEVVANRNSLEKLLIIRRESIAATDSLLTLFHEDIIENSVEELEALVAISVMGGFYTFDPNMGYLNSLINSGQINIISDKHLITLVTQFEAKVTDSREGTEMFRVFWAHQLGPVYSKYVRFTVPDAVHPKLKSNFPPNFPGFFSDPDVEYWMNHCNSWIVVNHPAQEHILTELDLMISKIDKIISK